MGIVHLPVMVREVLECLNPHPGGAYLDATVGLGGHAERVLGHIGADGVLIGIDRDGDALAACAGRISDSRLVLRRARFSELADVLRDLGRDKVDGVMFDLGVSMLQFRAEGRGFSFNSPEPLDMRMDSRDTVTARDIVNGYDASELDRILREYGEEWRSRRIVRFIVEARKLKPVETCIELADIVYRAVGRSGRTHPATKTFQALRIAVNRELEELGDALSSAASVLNTGGRLVVISYHSIEDRVVKRFMKDEGQKGTLQVLTKKPLAPGPEELAQNPSARSAKLRAAEAI